MEPTTLSTAPTHAEAEREEGARRPWRTWLGLALVVLTAAGPFVQDWSAQPASRYSLTAAVVEEGTIRIDSYRAGTAPIDRVERGDALYSDKAPGQPFFAVPFLAVGKAAGLEDATVVRIEENLGLWWIVLWSSVLPVAAMVVLMYEAARRFYPSTAVPAALALWAGTMWLVLSATLYGHALATLAAFAAWMVLADRTITPTRAILAGFLVGLSVLTEYPMVIVVVALGGYIVVKRAYTKLIWFAIGGIPPAIALVAYQLTAFGNPFRNPYAAKAGRGSSHVSVDAPDPVIFLQVVAGRRGLIFTAIVLVGAVAAVWIVRRNLPGVEHAWMAIFVFGAFLLMQSGWPNPWGGEVPGPRYLMPAIPWLAVPVAAAWGQRRRLCVLVTVVGAGFMTLALVSEHLIPHGASFLPWYVDQIREHGFAPSIYTMVIGPVGWPVHIGLLVAAAVYLARARRTDEATVGSTSSLTKA
jgi:hypothetical protein